LMNHGLVSGCLGGYVGCYAGFDPIQPSVLSLGNVEKGIRSCPVPEGLVSWLT
jgi:hypothetical protein